GPGPARSGRRGPRPRRTPPPAGPGATRRPAAPRPRPPAGAPLPRPSRGVPARRRPPRRAGGPLAPGLAHGLALGLAHAHSVTRPAAAPVGALSPDTGRRAQHAGSTVRGTGYVT